MSEQSNDQVIPEPRPEWTTITLRVKGVLTLADIIALLGDASEHVSHMSVNDGLMW